jgi:FKBP-type peptidyl-prolyl cis-trans isomerase FklB
MWGIVKQVMKGSMMRMIGLSFIICHLSFSVCACSEENDEEGEFDNWKERNDGKTDQWATRTNGGWYRKILTYTKNEQQSGLEIWDYIYVELLEKGSGTESPMFTDEVRVAYRGRYIPTKSYTDGYVFDQTYLGDFDWQTAKFVDFSPADVVTGFGTALMNMHVGDRWRVHIPYQLAYGASGNSSSSSQTIPGYTNLIFDIAVQNFWHLGEYPGIFKSK